MLKLLLLMGGDDRSCGVDGGGGENGDLYLTTIVIKSHLKDPKTLWKNEKMLETSIFSFSYTVQTSLCPRVCLDSRLFGKQAKSTSKFTISKIAYRITLSSATRPWKRPVP